MSRYDGLIIPRSYSEYINKTDAATLQQALQLSGVLSGAVAGGDNKAVTSNAVNGALANYNKVYSYFTGSSDEYLLIGKTIKANLNQAFTSLEIQAGRVDGWLGSGTLSMRTDGNQGTILGIRNTDMSNVGIYVTRIGNESYVYASMMSYSTMNVKLARNSNFEIVMQAVPNLDGVMIWNNEWQLYATNSDLANLKVLPLKFIGSLFFTTDVIAPNGDHDLTGYIQSTVTWEKIRTIFPNFDPVKMEAGYTPLSIRPLTTWESMPAYIYVNESKTTWFLKHRGSIADSYEIQLSIFIYLK